MTTVSHALLLVYFGGQCIFFFFFSGDAKQLLRKHLLTLHRQYCTVIRNPFILNMSQRDNTKTSVQYFLHYYSKKKKKLLELRIIVNNMHFSFTFLFKYVILAAF